LACVRPDAAADAAHLEVHPPRVDGVEKWADPVRGARVRGAHCHQSARRAEPAAEPDAAELCTPAAVRFAERSCAAAEAAEGAEQPDVSQPERLLKSPETEAQPKEEPVPLVAASPGARVHSPVTMLPMEAQLPNAPKQQEPLAAQPPARPEAQLLASSPLG